MARRNRYREMEYQLTRILIADVIVFVLYLITAHFGVNFLKWLTAIVAILGSGFCGGFLYINGEWKKRRSLWMFMGFCGIALCVLVSIIAKFPAPAITG